MKISIGAKTIALPLPAWVICTYDEAGKANAMTASWAGVCCSDPPAVYFSARKSRHTHAAVTARRAFTVCIPGLDQAAATDYFGTASGRNTDKISAAGYTAIPATGVDAPFLDEFPLILECALRQSLELGSHTMFIGEIVDVKCDQDKLDAEGKPAGALIKPFIYSTADGRYYGVAGELGQGYQLGKSIAG